jgi:hypothetical protein
MAFGVLGGTALQDVVRQSHGVTMAMAAMTPTGAVLAADSLETRISDGRLTAQAAVDKVRSGPSWGLLLAGLSRVDDQRLLDALDPAVRNSQGVLEAAHAAVTVLGSALGPHRAALLRWLQPNEVLWELLLTVRETGGGWGYLQLRSYRAGDEFALHVHQHEPAPGGVATAVLGTRHPRLQRFDHEYHRGHAAAALSAQLTYAPVPPAPVSLPATGLAVAVRDALDQAVATQQLADRPGSWPDDAPVAAGPVQCGVIGAVA